LIPRNEEISGQLSTLPSHYSTGYSSTAYFSYDRDYSYGLKQESPLQPASSSAPWVYPNGYNEFGTQRILEEGSQQVTNPELLEKNRYAKYKIKRTPGECETLDKSKVIAAAWRLMYANRCQGSRLENQSFSK
jgi:hypothetical protein